MKNCTVSLLLLFFFIYFLTLQYCIGFAIYQYESATGIHVFPVLNPQAYWSGLPFPSPGDLPDPGIQPVPLACPALVGRFFTSGQHLWEGVSNQGIWEGFIYNPPP